MSGSKKKIASQDDINAIDAEVQEIKNLISDADLAKFHQDNIDNQKVAKLVKSLDKAEKNLKKKYTQKRLNKFYRISDEIMENILTKSVAKEFEKSKNDSIDADIDRTVIETREYIESCQLDQLDKQLETKADNLMAKYERAAENFKKNPNQYNLNKFDTIGSQISNEILNVANKAWEAKNAVPVVPTPKIKSKPLPKTPPEIEKEKENAKIQMRFIMNEISVTEKTFRETIQKLVHFVNVVIETNPTGSTPKQLEQLKQFISPYQEIAANGKGLTLTQNIHQDLPQVIRFIDTNETWAGMLEASKNHDAFQRLMIDINQNQKDKHQPALSELYASYEKFNWQFNPNVHLILPTQRSARYGLLLRELNMQAEKAGLSVDEINPLTELIKNTALRGKSINDQVGDITKPSQNKDAKTKDGKDMTQRMRVVSRSLSKGIKNLSGRLESKAAEKEAKKSDFFARLDKVLEEQEAEKIDHYGFAQLTTINDANKSFPLDQQAKSGEDQTHVEEKR